MSTVIPDLTTDRTCLSEAWRIIEAGEPGDEVSINVAIDYVMDATGWERAEARSQLCRYVEDVLNREAETNPKVERFLTTLGVVLEGGDFDGIRRMCVNHLWMKEAVYRRLGRAVYLWVYVDPTK